MRNINHYIERRFVILTSFFFYLLVIVSSGCKKLVTVAAPVTSITDANVYSSNATAAAVLTGIYTNFSAGSFATGGYSISLVSGLSADEFTLLSGNTGINLFYYTNSLTSTNVEGMDPWSFIYQYLYTANSAVEGLTNNKSLTPAVQQQLMGEALFVRAFCFFYLVNIYGDVPLVTGTDYKVNEALPRADKADVWKQIVTDLTSAQTLLSSNYLKSDASTAYSSAALQRVRPTKWAAEALLARSYLYTGNYSAATAEADSVIANSSLFGLDTLNGVFLANSKEAIWQLQPVTTGTTNTQDGFLFILPSEGPNTGNNPVYLSANLLKAFEAGDRRRVGGNWVDSVIVGADTFYYPFKYKVNAQDAPVSEYSMVLRLGEQYLIRAEAEVQLGDLQGASRDLNMIRNRAGLGNTTAVSQLDLYTAILHERQVELFTEWGHRWFDLIRTGNVNSVMGNPGNVCITKGGIWSPDWALYPISLTELQTDPNLVQNGGY